MKQNEIKKSVVSPSLMMRQKMVEQERLLRQEMEVRKASTFSFNWGESNLRQQVIVRHGKISRTSFIYILQGKRKPENKRDGGKDERKGRRTHKTARGASYSERSTTERNGGTKAETAGRDGARKDTTSRRTRASEGKSLF